MKQRLWATRELIKDVVLDCCYGVSAPPSKAAQEMGHLVLTTEKAFPLGIKTMVQGIIRAGRDFEGIRSVMAHILEVLLPEEEPLAWAQVVAVLIVMRGLAGTMTGTWGDPGGAVTLAQDIIEHLGEICGNWMMTQGNWTGFVEWAQATPPATAVSSIFQKMEEHLEPC